MYKPHIKEKHPLIDLTRYGTRSRKKIHSEVLVGEHPSVPIFKEGDILDANATFNIIQDAYDQKNVSETISKFIRKQENELYRLEKNVDKLEQKEVQDMQNMKTYVDTEISDNKLRFSFEDADENLIVFSNK